ncbi:Ig-like domain-containing protein [Nitrosomonas aestuarii]|uniref:Ig-like domain-containing protein n=1 Tax=Nitrosomonas aestuarii TaxID=52441 RepID=UPI000D318CCA|nr:Ig-like domain-containing protein [Nitrosomonas aestuarii]PTN11086.1 hypothetical protein C8R11_11325 [Nitrosomonas aestuarii]
MNITNINRQITFTIGDVSINVVENANALDFTVTSLGDDDLRGLFFDFNNTAILSSLILAGGNITNQAIEDEGVINLKHGVNLQGTGLMFDIGIAFGTPGAGKDIIQQTEFTLSSTTTALTLDDIANVEFGVRTTNEGDKLTAIAPAAPDAINDSYDIFEDGQAGLNAPSKSPDGVILQVLKNDTDADGDTLTINYVTNALHGTVMIVDGDDADNEIGDAILYTPDADYAGTDTFGYGITDNNGGIDFATVNVSIAAVADIPSLTINTSSTANVNEVIFTVTATQQDADLSEFIDRIEVDLPISGATISPLQSTSSGLPDTYTQDFLLTLPENESAEFDLVFKAVSKENGNGDEESVSETIHVASTSQTITENSNWEKYYSSPFSYDFNKFRGATTNGLKKEKKEGAGFTVGGEADIDIGIQEDFDFDAGTLRLRVNRDTTVDTFYNSLTDTLKIDTSSVINYDDWILLDPVTVVELSAIFDFYADAFASVNPGGVIGNLGTIRLSDISNKLSTMNNLNIDAPFVTFNNDTVPEGVIDLTVANPALLNDKGELPAFLDFVSIFYEKPGDISGWSGNPHDVETSKVVTYDIDLDELIWNMFELAVFPSLVSKDGIKLALTQLAFDLNLNPFNFEVSIPGTGLFLDAEMADFDIVVDYDLTRTTDFDLDELAGKIIFEDGSSFSFVAGDTLTFANASAIDLNNNGIVEYNLELDQTGTIDHKAEFSQDHSIAVEALDIRGGYDGILGKWVGSTTPLPLIDETFKSVHYNLFDGTLPFELATDQFSLSAQLA